MGERMKRKWKGGETKTDSEMKAFRVWTGGVQRGRFLLTRAVGGMWTSPTVQQDQHWLTHREKFTGEFLVTWVHRHFPMVPLGWYQWQEASTAGPRKGRGSHHCTATAWDKLMDQQSYPRLFATCARLNQQKIALFSTANDSILSINYHSLRALQEEYFAFRGQISSLFSLSKTWQKC